MACRLRAALRGAPALLLVLAAACSDSTGPVVTTVTVTPADPSVIVGQTRQLTATARDANGNVMSGRQVDWSSGTESVATVSTGGLVTGVAAGSAQITATINGRSGSVDVTVTPPPVANITILPGSPAAQVNGTVQLTATTRDAAGGVLTGRTVTWSSGNEAIATVDGTGLARGLSAGTVDITAEWEGVSASVPLVVSGPPGSLVLSSITPAQLVEGQSATIMGDGFSASASSNTVTIDGVAAPVTVASSTSLTITVPSGGCMPARADAVVRVVVGAESAQRTHAARPAAFTDLPVGELTLLSNPQNFCVQLDASAAGSSYLIGVQSVSEVATSRTNARVQGRAAAAGGPALSNARVSTSSGVPLLDPAGRARAARLARHHDAELALRQHEQELAPRLFAAARRSRNTPSGLSSAMSSLVPSGAQVGDTVDVRFPDTSDRTCTAFTPIKAVVRHRGTRSFWVEDVGNPAGGFSAADYAEFSGKLDNQIWTTNTTYFGEPTDLDGNQRIVIVITKQVNARQNILGFVWSGDFFPADCASSNGGEYYYGIAPDPNGAAGDVYTTEDALLDGTPLIAHEFTHIIQLGRRLFDPAATALQTVWELEGQATFAEEVNGHAFTGNTVGQNYGFATAFNNPATQPISWYAGHFSDLAFYYGYSAPGGTPTKIANAPEQCGWLAQATDADSMGPCQGRRRVYGVSWSFLRWLSDQYGPAFPGGEAALHRALVDDTRSGFPTIENVIGRPIDELLAHWAAALYADDRYTGLNAQLRYTSWNFTGIFNALVPAARLTPRARTFSNFTNDVTVIAGSTAYFVVSGAARPATSLSFRSQTGTPLPASMRIWIVRTQ